MVEPKEVCSKEIWGSSSFHYCWHKVTTHEEGKPWCAIHAPSYVAKMRAERIAQEDVRMKEIEAKRAQQALHERQAALYPELVAALEESKRLFNEALPKFNWGVSALDANAIDLLNTVPRKVQAVLTKVKALEEAKHVHPQA